MISPNSETSYMPHIVEFIRYLDTKKPEYLNPLFRDNAARSTSGEISKAYITSALDYRQGRKSGSVLTAEAEQQMDSDTISFFIASVTKKDESSASFSVYSTRRSAILYLFRIFGRGGWPATAQAGLTNFFKGLKRTLAQQKATSGTAKIVEGKEALQFDLFRYLNLKLLLATDTESVFTHCFQVLSWNLICRSNNTAMIKYKHVHWTEDSLSVYFPQMKNDQEGDRPKDARHVYANPILPEICPILALGLYFLVFGFDAAGLSLFSGTSQYNRYLKQLHRLLTAQADELNSKGLEPSDLGTHSTRKGAASFTSSGSTSCPSIMAITLRAGWTMGKVESAYYRYEGAGDQHVGRTVTGLPPNKADFAILPPHFKHKTETVKQAVRDCFPNAPSPTILSPEVLEFCLASVVHHSDYIRANNPRHPVFQSALFSDPRLVDDLKPLVVCRLAEPTDRIQPTGVPLNVSILGEIQELKRSNAALCAELKELKSQQAQQAEIITTGVAERVTSILEERAVGFATVTPAGLAQQLDSHMQSLRAYIQQQFEMQVPPAAAQPAVESAPLPPPPLLRDVPTNFKLAKMSPQQAWQQYWLGNHAKGYPPLRLWKSRDMGTKTARNRFGEFLSLMKKMEQHLKNQQGAAWQEPTTLDEVNQQYSQACHVIAVPEETPKHRRRRLNELSWSTVKKLRRHVED